MCKGLPKTKRWQVTDSRSLGPKFVLNQGPKARLLIRSDFITPSDARWRRCRPLEMLTYWRVCCAFESACALPSAVIRGCETTSNNREEKTKRGWTERPNPFSGRLLNYFLNLFLSQIANPISPVPNRIIAAGSGTAIGCLPFFPLGFGATFTSAGFEPLP